MGEGVFMGVPRVLSGVRKVLAVMDWHTVPTVTYGYLLLPTVTYGYLPQLLVMLQVLAMMDWQAEAGEDYEGLLGAPQRLGTYEPPPTGDGGDEPPPEGLICFGGVGAAEVAPDDDVLIVLAPQSMVGGE